MRSIGRIVLLVLPLAWLDADHSWCLRESCPVVGHYSECGVRAWREVSPSDREDVFQGAKWHDASLLAEMHRGQRRTGEFMGALESPWAPDKSKPRSSHSSFLGPQHDGSQDHWSIMTFGYCTAFCTRSGYHRCSLTDLPLHRSSCQVVRVIDFLGNSMFRRMGRAVTSALEHRHCEAGAEVIQPLAILLTSS